MKNLLLIFSCLLLVFLFPMEKLEGVNCGAKEMVDNEMNLGAGNSGNSNHSVCDAELSSDVLYCAEGDVDVVYDDDVITLLNTYNSPNDDVIPTCLNQWGRQLRILTSRLQFRYLSITLQVKRLTHLMSIYLTTLINHISQSYSTLKQPCWQYASDCYVFAFRQIII